jgi:hypothetical protein
MSFSNNRASNVSKTLSEKDSAIIARWEKERADGKWFWIFKRASAWVFVAILLYGAAQILTPNLISLSGDQLYIAVFMFAGFFVGSVMEWSKMEKLYQRNALAIDKTVS